MRMEERVDLIHTRHLCGTPLNRGRLAHGTATPQVVLSNDILLGADFEKKSHYIVIFFTE